MPNVIFINATSDAGKPSFIRTCDAMIHGRENCEMFGLALAELSIMRRPIFTSGPKAPHLNARAHLDILGDKAFVHTSSKQLVSQLQAFEPTRAVAQGEYWNAYSRFEPDRVMWAFDCVFLRGQRCRGEPGAPPLGASAEADSCSRCEPYSVPVENGCVKPRGR